MVHLEGLVPRAQGTTAQCPQSPHPQPQQHVHNRWTPTMPEGRAPDPVGQSRPPPVQLSEAAQRLPELGRTTGHRGLGRASPSRCLEMWLQTPHPRGLPQTSPQGGHGAHAHAPGQKTSHVMSHGPQGPVFIENTAGGGAMAPSPGKAGRWPGRRRGGIIRRRRPRPHANGPQLTGKASSEL